MRGADIDEGRFIDADPAEAAAQAPPLRYLHPTRPVVRLLDKPLSFDDTQEALFAQAPPLIMVGGAGSGKTVMLLEKLKAIDAHAAFEEMRGVLAAHPDGPLTLPAYLALGVRQSLFVDAPERERMHALFGRYRARCQATSALGHACGPASWRSSAFAARSKSAGRASPATPEVALAPRT